MKFKKKPLIVEAEQWFPCMEIEGVKNCYEDLFITIASHAIIKTLEGSMIVNPGDWIITGIEGEKYCCKNSIFQKTYEKVEE